MTAPQKSESPGGAGQIAEQSTNTSSLAQADAERKRIATLAAMFARRGFAVHRLEIGGFLVGRWNLTKHCADLGELESFAQKVGVIG